MVSLGDPVCIVRIEGIVRLLSNITKSLRKPTFPCHSMNKLKSYKHLLP